MKICRFSRTLVRYGDDIFAFLATAASLYLFFALIVVA